MRAVMTAPADMQSYFFWRDTIECMIERIDPYRCISAVFRQRYVGQTVPAIWQVGIVNLQQKAGIDNRPVLLAHYLGDGKYKFLVAFVVLIQHPMFDRTRGIGRQKGSDHLHSSER